MKIALEPVVIKPPTLVYKLWEKGMYSRVWLWSIIDILKQTSKWGDIYIGISPEGMRWEEMPRNCKKCTKNIIKSLKMYNVTRSLGVFKNFKCECIKKWKRELNRKKVSLRKRVEKFYSKS